MYEDLKRMANFSEGQYLSEEEVQAKFNLADVSSTWEKILAYRSLFRYNLALKTPERNAYHVTLNRTVLGRAIALERKILVLALKVSTLSEQSKVKVYQRVALSGLRWVSDNYQLGLSDKEIIAFCDDSLPSIEPKNRILGKYMSVWKKVKELSGLDYFEMLSKINCTLLDSKDDSQFQMRNMDDEGRGFQCSKNVLAGELKDFGAFLDEHDDIPLIVKLCSAVYMFSYLEPCAYFNQETGCILLRTYLEDQGFDDAGFFFPLESLMYSTYGSLLSKCKLSLHTGDLTYFIMGCLPIIERSINSLESSISELISEDVRISIPLTHMELKKEEPVKVEGIGSQKFMSMTPDVNAFSGEPHYFQTDENHITTVSVPSYSTGKYPKVSSPKGDHDDEVLKLMEKHPVLRKNVADFYITHRNIGSFYTIDQFKAYEGVAYETARTSMDLLANLGFYKKSKTGKKFVYTPLPQGGLKL